LNKGYAFINFTTAKNAEKFRDHFRGFSNWMFLSEKDCEISWSDANQGLDAYIQHFRNSPMMHGSVDDKFKPVLFSHGRRISFPKPTKPIKAPKTKTQCLANCD